MEEVFEPQYPAALYTKRPNDTALLSPLYDYTFKGLFTQETKESYLALQSFISAVLGRKVINVTLKSNEFPKETNEQKGMTFDVTAEFDDGEISDIEMQARKEDYDYGIRAEIHAARLLANNAKKGQNWESSKVYQISVLNFHYEKDDKDEMTWYTMRSRQGKELTQRLNVIFIDLVSIRKKAELPVEELTPVEKWGLFLSYVDHEKQATLIDNIVRSEEGLMAADIILRHMSQEDSNWFTQNSIDTYQRDRNTILANAEKRGLENGMRKGLQQGLEKGMKQGLQQGLQQKAEEAALNLLKMNLCTPEQISQVAGLPLEKVLELKDKAL